MKTRLWLKMIAGALALAALLAMPGLPLPGADSLGLSGKALAQETIDIDTFYDELAPYGQWVWHPRFGYVWLPEEVSPNWRPYTIGHWVSTEEYGWYWESNEPFAWAVYHYGRWGYDPEYGWFWVPGDTWAPAWVQWRYDDDYVGWAPIGPRRVGYAYGVPASYEPPIAESWVFVRPRYLTSRAIPHYAVPIGDLGTVFIGATRVYRPQFHGGVVYNYGIPRNYVVRITKRPIYVKKVYKVDSWKGGRYDKNRHGNGIRIYAPGVHKNHRPDRRPKNFADHPNQFKPKAKLNHTVKGNVPKGWGPSAKSVKSIAKQDPDAFKKHGRFDGKNGFDRKDKDRDKDQANKAPGGFDKDRDKDKNKAQANQGRHDHDRKGGHKDAGVAKVPPPIVKGGNGEPKEAISTDGDRGDRNHKHGKDRDKQKGFSAPGGPNEFRQGSRDNDRHRNENKNKNFGSPNGQGGPNQARAFDQNGQGGGHKNRNKDRDKGERGNHKNAPQFTGPGGAPKQAQGGGGGGGKNNKKCQKHPEKPECQGRN